MFRFKEISCEKFHRLSNLEGASFVGGVCLRGGNSSFLGATSDSAFCAIASDLDSVLAFKLILARSELLRLEAGDRKSGVGDNKISFAPSVNE